MTAINIPNMVQIVRYNNLVPVPVDLQLDTISPKLEDIEKEITPKVSLSIRPD